MKEYICLASEPWGAHPSRTQHLMSRFQDAKVLYFEPPASPHSQAHKKPGRRVRSWLTRYTLPSIPDSDGSRRLLCRLEQKKVARFIRSKMETHRLTDPVLWCTAPRQIYLLDALPYQAVVYDCDRDWPNVPPEWESDLALSAEVVFAASPGLMAHLAPCNENIALLPNGVNFSLFQHKPLELPTLLCALSAPLFGCIGTIARDTDLSPVLFTARKFPSYTFLFAGRLERNHLLPSLRDLPNVRFVKEPSLQELPGYLVRFDVCFHLLRQEDLGNDIIPERMYEYLSAGKPVVSMLWEDQVETFPDVVYGAHSTAEFAQLCTRALAETGDWAKNRRQAYGAGAAWNLRAEEACHILKTIGLY